MKLLLLDANSLINRAFYAIRLLTNSKGVYTNAVYGFLSTYCRLIEEEEPDGVCACFDLKGATFRHLQYAEYKAGRRPMPEELKPQFDLLRQVLGVLHVPCLDLPGFEADDLLGTMSRKCEESGDTCIVCTGDRDSLQLAGPHTSVRLITTSKGESVTTLYTPEVFFDTYGVTPAQYIDVKALMGDASDNIPGVAGIGEKTAFSLIQTFGSLDGVYAWLDAPTDPVPKAMKPAVRKHLEECRENAVLSRRLAEIDRNAPLDFAPEQARLTRYDKEELGALLHSLELRSLYPRVESGKGFLPPALLAYAPDEAGPAIPVQEDDEPIIPLTAPGMVMDILAGNGEIFLITDGSYAAFRKNGVNYVLNCGMASEHPDILRRLAEVPKVMHDAKPAMTDIDRILAGNGVSGPEVTSVFGNVTFDTAIAAYLLAPTVSDFSLDAVAASYTDRTLPPLDPNAGETFIPRLRALETLRDILRTKLEEQGMTPLFRDVEMPLIRILADMQIHGTAIDRAALAAYSEELGARIARLERDMEECTGVSINWNSPRQLGVLLFETLGLPGGKKTRTGYSTDADILKRMQHMHPVVGMALEYRQLTKLKNTYADGLVRFICADGRIHSHFQQTVTATGRLSSADPNMQNIPVRKELGAELRRMFVAPEGWVLVDADYSQIELRLLAHIAGDENMIRAFAEGADIHRRTAATVAGISEEAVTPEMRSRAKAVNFGIVYGISEFSLSEDLGISRYAARDYIKAYFAAYPGIAAYMENIKARAKEEGCVRTLFGRKRALPELASSNRNIRAFGERVALNMPVQGTAADIMKIAMIRVCRRLRKEGLRARLILQVHDELILEAPREEAEAVTALVCEEMERAARLDVTLTAEAGTGENWYEAKS